MNTSTGLSTKKINRVSRVVLVALVALSVVGPGIAHAAGPAAVDLLSAGNFVILSKAGVTNTDGHTSVVTGNVGSSPITAAAIDNVFCSEITGVIYGVDAAYVGSGDQSCFAGNPPFENKTLVDNAVLDMGTAYADAAGRTNPTATELGAGDIGGMTLTPGLYKWSTNLIISSDVTLSGGENDVWIFQIAGDLSIASGGDVVGGVKVVLSGGARAANVFWQVGGVTGATLGTYSTFNGNILSAKQIILQTGVVLNGRALAQTGVTLDANRVTVPPAASVSPEPEPEPTPAPSPSPAPTPTPSPTSPDVVDLQLRVALQSQIDGLLTTVRSLQAQVQAGQGGSSASTSAFGQQVKTIAISIGEGNRGSEVQTLQEFLISQNKGSAAQTLAGVGATAYFGSLTRAALAEFQAEAGINPPLGNFGPITRAYLMTHY